MCKKTWRPQVNKQLRKKARRNIVDAKLFSLRKQNSGFCNNYSLVVANANKQMLWEQKS